MQQAQNNFLKSNPSPKVFGDYFDTVHALTPKESLVESDVPAGVESTPLIFLFSPLLIYGSVILFFGLFLGAIAVQLVRRSLDAKRTMASLIVVFVIAIMPITVRTALVVTSYQSQAGPDEVPREVTLTQTTANSFAVSWETTAFIRGAVRYGPAPLTEQSSRVAVADDGKKSQRHTAVLTSLKQRVEYELEILSGTEWYDNSGEPIKFRLKP